MLKTTYIGIHAQKSWDELLDQDLERNFELISKCIESFAMFIALRF